MPSRMSGMSALSNDQQLLVDLVSTPSVTGSEAEAASLFVRRARQRGFQAGVDEATNAVAHRGTAAEEARAHIVLLGHIDTVPGDIPVRIECGTLFGRGSVDAKGPLCAMLCAATGAMLPPGVRVSVIGAAGEEGDSNGARSLASKLRPDACIIGEPSGWDGVTLGYKGRLVVTATASCQNHHSAGRDPSASDVLFRWWSDTLEYLAAFNEGRTRVFDSIQATIQDLDAASDGLHQIARLQAGFRLPVGVSPYELASELETLAAGHMSIEINSSEVACATDRNDPVVRALSAAIRAQNARPRPKLKTGTADFNVVGPVWNCPIAAYGPGDSAFDHTPDEQLELSEYDRSIEVLSAAITTLAEELLAAHRQGKARCTTEPRAIRRDSAEPLRHQ